MKVVIATFFPERPEAPRGGVEAVSVNLVRALSTFPDLDIHVVTHGSGKGGATRVEWEGATVHRLPTLKGSMLGNAVGAGRHQLSDYLMALGPDLVHAHDTYGLMVQGLPIPRVFTIHGFIYGDTLLSGKKFPRLRSRLWKFYELRSWADQPHIISISPYVRERLGGVATGTIHDIDNPISESFFRIERNERKGVIFSAAVINPRKNTLGLVDSIALLLEEGVDVQLRLAGPEVDPRYADLVRKRIREKDLEGKVHLLGRLDVDRVKEELSVASVFALVSLEENSPMGIEESMAAGVPVVTSNRCGMPYMVRHGVSGFLVDPHRPVEIAGKLRHLLEDDPLRASMGRKSTEIALDRFHPAVVASHTREVYFEAVE